MAEHGMTAADIRNPRIHHEKTEASARGIVWLLVVMAIGGVAVQLGLWSLFRYFAARESASYRTPFARTERAQLPPEPRLEGIAPAPLATPPRESDEGYGWVDKEAGIVRVPIGTAMDMLAEPAEDPREQRVVVGPSESNSGRVLMRDKP